MLCDAPKPPFGVALPVWLSVIPALFRFSRLEFVCLREGSPTELVPRALPACDAALCDAVLCVAVLCDDCEALLYDAMLCDAMLGTRNYQMIHHLGCYIPRG